MVHNWDVAQREVGARRNYLQTNFYKKKIVTNLLQQLEKTNVYDFLPANLDESLVSFEETGLGY